jgi:hypothetical protein
LDIWDQQTLVAVCGSFFHAECLRCADCGTELGAESEYRCFEHPLRRHKRRCQTAIIMDEVEKEAASEGGGEDNDDDGYYCVNCYLKCVL